MITSHHRIIVINVYHALWVAGECTTYGLKTVFTDMGMKLTSVTRSSWSGIEIETGAKLRKETNAKYEPSTTQSESEGWKTRNL